MQLTHRQIEIPEQIDPENPPADFIVRQANEHWYMPREPFTPGKPVTWLQTMRGDRVLVPLVPYLTPAAPELALAFMLQIGISLASQLQRPVRRLHIATGSPVNEVVVPGGPDGAAQSYWQYYVGIAALL